MSIRKIKISFAKNVNKVWISRNLNLLTPFFAIAGCFFMGWKSTKVYIVRLFSMVIQWLLFPLFGPLAAIHAGVEIVFCWVQSDNHDVR